MPYIVTQNELTHYGIQGQKRGVRRYQNEDRTWTEEGKIRYGRKSEKRTNPRKKTLKNTPHHPDYDQVHDGKKYFELSTDELNRRVNRLNKENDYIRLTEAQQKSARKIFNQALKDGKSVNEAVDTVQKIVKTGSAIAGPIVAIAGTIGLANLFGFNMPMGSGGWYPK